ncbi:hypothetical protein N7528_000118 [Penicillium herquei]|nr:hypothetical protein N7528_000118 [Penicillium herquei]
MANRPLDESTCYSLLYPRELQEQSYRDWGGTLHPGKPLLRTWDEHSRNKIDESGRILASAPRQPLRTKQSRKLALAIHASRNKSKPTPFISCTHDKYTAEHYARMKSRRGTQMLTVIDLMVRVEKRLPVLQMRSEAYYYNVINKCQCGMRGDSYSYYLNHQLCLWEVTKEEIVGTWAWEDLWKYPDWYGEVILPAYIAHSEGARMRREKEMQSGRLLLRMEFRGLWPGEFIIRSGRMRLISAVDDECHLAEEVENVGWRVSSLDESSSPEELVETDESGSSEEEGSWYELDSDDVYQDGEVEQGRSSAEDVKSEVGGGR